MKRLNNYKKNLAKFIAGAFITGSVLFNMNKAEASNPYHLQYHHRTQVCLPIIPLPFFCHPPAYQQTCYIQEKRKNKLTDLINDSVWKETSESVAEGYFCDNSNNDFISFKKGSYKIVDGANEEFEGYFRLNPSSDENKLDVYFSKYLDFRERVYGSLQFNKERNRMSLTIPGKILSYELERRISNLPLPIPVEVPIPVEEAQ